MSPPEVLRKTGKHFGEFVRAAIAQAEAQGIKVERNFDPATIEALPGCD